MGPDLLDST